jgi:pimeloyl-ACP methyl ester carboxylesterase
VGARRHGLLERSKPSEFGQRSTSASTPSTSGPTAPRADTFVAGFDPGGQHGQIAANVSWMDGGESRINELAGMQVPCLMTANEHDPFFALADMERAAATIPDCRLEIFPGISHVQVDPLARLNTVAIEHFSTH